MYENSDSDRTTTSHEVGFLWAAHVIESYIKELNHLHEEMCGNLEIPPPTSSNNSRILFWAPELETYNEDLEELMIKVTRAMERLRVMCVEREATHEDLQWKDALTRAWKRSAKAFDKRVVLYDEVRKRAAMEPTADDVAAIELLGGRQMLGPQFYWNDQFMAFSVNNEQMRVPRYLRGDR